MVFLNRLSAALLCPRVLDNRAQCHESQRVSQSRARCFLLWAIRKSSLQLAPQVLWLVLVSVGCYMPDPGLEAILRDATSRKQNPASQNALTPRTPTTPPTHPTVAGTAMTWTNGTQTWAGNPFCAMSGSLPSANSPTVDQGSLIVGFHCPKPGSALNQPRISNGDYCQEWYGASPDLGSCEYVPQ